MSRLGEYIEEINIINDNLEYSFNDVRGMTIAKEIIPTKASESDRTELKKYKIIKPKEFVYNPRTHGKRIGLGFNDSEETILISWNNGAFKIKKDKICELDATYLFIWFNRLEWDRNACFRSWGSSTEVFSWEELCNMELEVPKIETQKKYVAIYDAMKRNLKAYETGLEELKLVCDGYIEKLKREYPLEKLERFIKRYDIRNSENKIKNVKGVSTSKEFREPTSKVNINELSNYKIVKPGTFSYVLTTHNEKVFAYALNDTKENIVVTSVNEVFETNKEKLLPEYLSLFFNRTEFDRYARFNSWGSARETFNWEDLIQVSIPVPDISIQKSIVSIYKIYKSRKMFRNKMKSIINNICPVLIKSSLSE